MFFLLIMCENLVLYFFEKFDTTLDFLNSITNFVMQKF